MTRSNTRAKYVKHEKQCGISIDLDVLDVIEINGFRHVTTYQCPHCSETFEHPYKQGDIVKMFKNVE
ncbi:MAG: hypothetical protein R2685_10730 [Candidatus Nitrosocosmicus sp.]|nr:hypothetical protein [Candidatus Nitrosocosmicus sp.]